MRELFNIGFSELIVVLLVAFLVVGPRDLPKVARTLARGIKQIRRMVDEVKRETGLDEVTDELNKAGREVQKTLKEADIRDDLNDAGKTLTKELNNAARQLKSEPLGPEPAAQDKHAQANADS